MAYGGRINGDKADNLVGHRWVLRAMHLHLLDGTAVILAEIVKRAKKTGCTKS